MTVKHTPKPTPLRDLPDTGHDVDRAGVHPAQLPASATAPLAAAPIQSLGRVSSASSVPLSAVAQVAGWAPVRNCSFGLVPTVLSYCPTMLLRRVVLSCTVMVFFH